MKRIILIVLLLVLVLAGIAAALYYTIGEREFLVKKEIQISTPSGFTFRNMSSFETILRWSPIKQIDPNVETKILGNDGFEGGILVWDGPKIGKGEEKIIGIGPFFFFETHMKLFEPYQMEGTSSIQMHFEAGTNDVIWGIKGKNSAWTTFKLMLQGTSLEKILGDRIELGLKKFQEVSENDYLEYLKKQAEQGDQPKPRLDPSEMKVIKLK